MKHITILFILLKLALSVLFAQDYSKMYFEQIDNTHGLLSDEVYTAAQDNKGFIWFGTSSGIERYDGYEFESFKDHPFLKEVYGIGVNKIRFDDEDNLYVCTNDGFFAFNKYYEPILSFTYAILAGKKLNDVIKASSGKIYITSQNGFYTIDPEKEIISQLLPTAENHMIDEVTEQVVEDGKGRIWVASWSDNILRLNEDGKTFTNYPISEMQGKKNSDLATKSLYVDSRGYLWLGSWESGLFVLDISSVSEVNVIKAFKHNEGKSNSIAGDIILSITEDQYNNIWVGTPYGLSVIQYPLSRNHKVINYKPEGNVGSISSVVINDLLNDDSDILWIATKGGGVNKLIIDRNKFDHIKIPKLIEQRRNQATYAFGVDHKGRLLAGVLSLGFVVCDLKNNEILHYSDVPEYEILKKHINLNTVLDFMWDRDSVLWLGTRYNGLVLLDPKSGNVDVIRNRIGWSNYRGRQVNVMRSLQNGSVLVGTDNCINWFNYGENGQWKSQYIELRDALGIPSGGVSVSGIVELNNDEVLVSTEQYGLLSLTFKKGNINIKPWGELKDKIISLFKDDDNRIWIGTKGDGLKYIDSENQSVVRSDQGKHLMGDMIFGINQDRYGNIWVTTNNGITRLDLHAENVSSESYFYRDGLQGNVFLPRSFYKDVQGDFYIGGYNGFNVFQPHRIKSNSKKAPVVITDIHVEGERMEASCLKDSVIQLDHRKNDLSIEFSSLSYIFPEANKYAYMIEGLDHDWKYVTSRMRSANYSNIPPGEYVFYVKGSSSQGIWNDEPALLYINVKPAPYKTWWAIIIYFIIAMVIFWFIVNERMKTLVIKQKMEIEQLQRVKSDKLNQYKLSFFTNMSHELLTPISILSSSLYNIKQKKVYSDESIGVMERSISGLERLIRQLLTFRKVETNNMKVKMTDENVSGFVTQCVTDFSSIANKRKVDLIQNVVDGVEGTIDREKWELILRNLLSNAFKYTSDGGTVTVDMKRINNEKVEIKVKDTGCGISAEVLPHLFDRFYSIRHEGVEDAKGIGIGLNLTKSLIDILMGDIAVVSDKEKGTTFTLNLPIDGSYNLENNNEEAENIAQQEELEEVFETTDEEEEEQFDNGTKTILIVEDNDDFRQMLKENLSSRYKILEACDGMQGLELAEKKEIDLIVSDVMMPNMSGNELCEKIKTNINTSHIPVLLLTAKIGDENKLAGYKAGANSYLEKPVNMPLLKVRIRSLLSQFDRLRAKTNVSLNLEPENIQITSIDEEFFNKAKKIIEQHMDDTEFSVVNFADELKVSNSMLYRKMRSLAGISPSEFIRNIRLKRAAQLLDNKAFQISEVAYNCGFNDLSYFGVCFKKMFGVTPTAYQAGERGEE